MDGMTKELREALVSLKLIATDLGLKEEAVKKAEKAFSKCYHKKRGCGGCGDTGCHLATESIAAKRAAARAREELLQQAKRTAKAYRMRDFY